jgi:hypothetical protein
MPQLMLNDVMRDLEVSVQMYAEKRMRWKRKFIY